MVPDDVLDRLEKTAALQRLRVHLDRHGPILAARRAIVTYCAGPSIPAAD